MTFCGVLTNSSLVCAGAGPNTTLAAHATSQAAGGLTALVVTYTGSGMATFAGRSPIERPAPASTAR